MLEEFVPGDFILTHRRRMFAALITLAQRRRFRGSDARFAHWSHAALIVGAHDERPRLAAGSESMILTFH